MKAYKIDGSYCDSIFYVGNKNQVESQLSEFFQWEVKSSENSLFDTNKQSSIGFEGSKIQISNDDKSKKSYTYSSNKSSFNSPQRKQISVHFLLYDLEVNEYNQFQSYIRSKFSQQLNKNFSPITLQFVIISSREESLRYIKKIDKFKDPQFQSNLVELYQELNQGMEYQLIKNFMQQNFDYEREEIFEWMKSTGVKKLEDFFVCQSMPSFQKKQVRRVLTNLSILEQLYEK